MFGKLFSITLIVLFCTCCTTKTTGVKKYKTKASGLKYLLVKEGTGKKAGDDALIIFHLIGSLSDKRQFLNSVENGRSIKALVKDIDLAGVREALSMMRKGSQMKLIVPANLAYGSKGLKEVKGYGNRKPPPRSKGERRVDNDTGYAAVPPDATVYFYIHLLEIVWSK